MGSNVTLSKLRQGVGSCQAGLQSLVGTQPALPFGDNMRILLLCLMMISNTYASDFAVGINAFSIHSKGGYEAFTPGIYVRGTGDLFGEIGILKNSYGDPTVHTGIGYSYKFNEKWDISLAVTLTYGYKQWEKVETKTVYHDFAINKDIEIVTGSTWQQEKRFLVVPIVSAGYKFYEDWGIRMFVIPPNNNRKYEAKPEPAWCFSFALEKYF